MLIDRRSFAFANDEWFARVTPGFQPRAADRPL